ncbi:fibronectin type III domain-containing protein [Dactylosporangium sp. CS-033363]|uniref:fibronectin type III domain-containing protein n=1 Tax=Dactylosporangium sp. CS-033363 TaxID=3239935 RepID=UPI003D902768
MNTLRAVGALLATAVGSGALVALVQQPAAAATTTTFAATGAIQTYTIPAGVTQLKVVAKGAQGGGDNGGPGGAVTALISVPPALGGKIQVMVGGRDGWNGGGAAGGSDGVGGGGASDIRQGTCAATSTCGLGDRTVVAGGGGGGVIYDGGSGGKPATPGYDMTVAGDEYGREGGPGTQSAGGAGGAAFDGPAALDGTAGAAGSGGNGGSCSCGGNEGHGGGGGYYGGGGGGASTSRPGGPGGGGSSYVDPARQDETPSFGTGDNYATGSIAITPVGPPAPGGLTAQVGPGSGAVDLGWTAPAGGADAYTVYQATSSGGPYTELTTGGCAAPTGPSCGLTGLTPGQEYHWKVASVRGIEGDPSDPVTATAIEPPAPPGTVSAEATGDLTLTVTFADPSTPAAPAPDHQVLVSRDGGTFTPAAAGTCAGAPIASPCTVTGLTAGASYRFQVQAGNAAGVSAASSPSAAVTAVAAPPAPAPGTVTATAPGTLTVAWTGSAASVKVYGSDGAAYTPVAAGTCAAAPTTSPCTVTGLTPGTAYTFKIASLAGAVEGPQSAATATATAVTTPVAAGAPALSLAGDRAIKVAWTYPGGTDRPATGFTVEVAKDGGAFAVVASGPCAAPAASPCTLSGLEVGASYQVRVTAANGAGSGPASSASAALSAVEAPGAPTIASIVPGDGTATVTWTAGSPAGGGITYHATAVPVGASSPRPECQVAAPALSCTIAGLDNGTQYTITVVASGAVDSLPSAAVTGTPSIAPSAPTVTVDAGTASIAVHWTAGAAGSGIAGYVATATPGPAGCETGPTGTGCVLGAVAGTPVTVTVIAKGTFGRDSAAATSPSVTATAPSLPATAPAANAALTTDRGDIDTAAPGERITVLGHGFAPHSTVTIALYSTAKLLAAAVADANGDVRQPVTVPAGLAAGEHRLVALGVDANGVPHTLALAVTVPAASSALPVTGLALTTMAMAGLGALGAGTVLRLAGRRPVRAPA